MSDADPRLLGFRDFFVRPVLPVFPVRWLPPVLPVWKLAPPSERPDSDGVLSALLIGGSPFVPRRSGSSDGPLSSRVSASGESAPLLPVLKDLSDIVGVEGRYRWEQALAEPKQSATSTTTEMPTPAAVEATARAARAGPPALLNSGLRSPPHGRTVGFSLPHSCRDSCRSPLPPCSWGQALGEGHASNSISLAAIAVSTAHVRHCGEGGDGDIFSR